MKETSWLPRKNIQAGVWHEPPKHSLARAIRKGVAVALYKLGKLG